MARSYKQRRCQEAVSGNGHNYLFAGTFGNIEAVSFVCGDPGQLMARLCENELPPADIRSVMLCCVEERDGKPVTQQDREDVADEVVESFGLQDCSLLAQHLLGYGLIGDVKKKQIERHEAVAGMARKFSPSTLTGFALLGSLWAVTCVSSAALACLIMRYF